MDTRLVVDVRDGADELGKYFLDLGRTEGTVGEEVVVELIACFWSAVAAMGEHSILPGQYSRTSQTSSSVTMTS